MLRLIFNNMISFKYKKQIAFFSNLLLFFLLALQVSAQHTKMDDLYKQTSEMADMMINYEADKGSLKRFYSNNNSDNDWADDYYNSPECILRLQQLIVNYLDQLEKVDFEKMNINGKVDYLLFKRNILDEQYKLVKEQKLHEQVLKYLSFSERINAIEKPSRRGASVNGEEVARELNSINKEISNAIEKLKSIENIELNQAMYASIVVNELRETLKKYYNFYNNYDPLFTWWVPKTYSATDSLLDLYAITLKKKGKLISTQKDDGSGIVGNPIGNEELLRQLKLEFISYSPEELVSIANKEFAWCDAELLKASNEMGFGDDWKAAQEKVKKSFVPAGKQPETMYELYKQSVNFLKVNDLISIPVLAEETWRMQMMSPQRQLVNPFFLGGESLVISYPTNTMTYDEKMMSMRGNNPNFSRATVHHELIAGHHLQGYMSNRCKSYRHFNTPFYGEGNALYWEMLLWDLKFPRTPEEKIGMLFWRMHRCARIIFSLNYHLGKWTPQQCIDFLVDRVGHERANAEGEVRRSFTGGYSPLYQIAYMIGGLEFMSLKRELVDTKKMTYKQYHDAILQENSMPIEMLRAIITNNKLTKDYKTNWRFYQK
jgi:hypothetical protein